MALLLGLLVLVADLARRDGAVADAGRSLTEAFVEVVRRAGGRRRSRVTRV